MARQYDSFFEKLEPDPKTIGSFIKLARIGWRLHQIRPDIPELDDLAQAYFIRYPQNRPAGFVPDDVNNDGVPDLLEYITPNPTYVAIVPGEQ